MELFKNLTLSAAKDAPADWMVVVMGVGVVFVGLILIIAICKIMSLFFTKSTAKKEETVSPAAAPAPVAAPAVIENRQEIIAAVTAVCAEEMGKDVSAIRVISFKKL